ncbi:MAG: hypothetical protein IKG87_17505, partial [Clostridia bacterium]|nr:hypothetical protein [Clostridia bacterium]
MTQKKKTAIRRNASACFSIPKNFLLKGNEKGRPHHSHIEHVITEEQCENRLSDWENKKHRPEERQIIRRQLRPDELPGWAERKGS